MDLLVTMTTGIMDIQAYNEVTVPILRDWLSVVTMRIKEIISTMDTKMCAMEIPVEKIIPVIAEFKTK